MSESGFGSGLGNRRHETKEGGPSSNTATANGKGKNFT